MECKKCSKTYEANLISCPFCGYMQAPIIKDTSNDSTINDTSSFPIIVIIILLIVGSIFYIVYNNKKKVEENNKLLVNHDITLDYKVKGYSFIDLNVEPELDGFDLINNNYKYIDFNSKISDDSFCNLYNINIENNNGSLIISGEDYSKEIDSINNVNVFTVYNKKTCECSDFNIVILTDDGKVFIYESDKIKYKDEKELINSIEFNEIRNDNSIRSIAITSYVGEIKSCGERVLLMSDNDNIKYIYRNNSVVKSVAPYSSIIYNVISNYSLYISTDRSMVLSSAYDSNLPLLKDDSNNIIKFIGSFKDKNSSLMYILSIDRLLYKLDLSKDVNNPILEHTTYGIVNDIGYKFDPHSNTMTYVFLFSGGGKTEFNGDFETHGVFSVR